VIEFFCEHIEFQPPNPNELKDWLSSVVRSEDHKLGDTNYIFCDDQYLLKLNQDYLGHNTYTDIITFDHSEIPQQVSGDIYISIERVQDNARKFMTDPQEELKRVMVHGLLHLLGYDDQSPEQQQEMRKKEEAYLSL